MNAVEFLLARIAEDEKLAVSGEFSIEQEERMFRECRAKRSIIDAYLAGTDPALDLAITYMAQVYWDHPDYMEAVGHV